MVLPKFRTNHGADWGSATANTKGKTMKTERRWLKSVIRAAQTEEVVLPWAARRADKHPTPPASAVIVPQHYAIAAR